MILDVLKFEELGQFGPIPLSDYTLVSFDTLSEDFEPKKAEVGKLYVLYASVLSTIDNISDAAGYICINDRGSDFKNTHFHFPVVLIGEGVEPEYVFQVVQESIASRSSYADEKEMLLDALATDKGIHGILNIAGQIYHNPFYFIDANYRMIAWSNNIQVEEPVWNQAVADGFVSAQMIESMRSIRVPEFGQATEKPMIVSIPGTDKHSIDSSIFIKGKFAGCVGMCDHSNPFREGDVDAADFVSKIISIQLQKSDFYRSLTGDLYESFFFDLLKSPLSSEATERRARTLNLELDKNYLILVINPLKNGPNKYLSGKMIQAELKQMIRRAHGITYHGNVVLVIGMKNESMLDEKHKAKIEEYLEKRGICGGFSNTSSDYSLLKTFYEQACIGLMHGSKKYGDRTLHFYSDHIMDYMLQLALENDSQINFMHPAIGILKEYDEKWHTDHLESLVVFMDALGNMAKAAQNLDIHYNTMKYRIKSLQNIAAIDLKDPDTYMNLSISLRQLTNEKE